MPVSPANGRVVKGDDMPDITISRAAVDESFFNSLTFVVTLSEPSPDAVTVQYRTLLNGTADEDDINIRPPTPTTMEQ